MKFKSDKQRKAVMSKMKERNGSSSASTSTISSIRNNKKTISREETKAMERLIFLQRAMNEETNEDNVKRLRDGFKDSAETMDRLRIPHWKQNSIAHLSTHTNMYMSDIVKEVNSHDKPFNLSEVIKRENTKTSLFQQKNNQFKDRRAKQQEEFNSFKETKATPLRDNSEVRFRIDRPSITPNQQVLSGKVDNKTTRNSGEDGYRIQVRNKFGGNPITYGGIDRKDIQRLKF